MCRPWTGAARMPPLDGQGRHNAAPAAPGFSHFRPRPWKIFFLPHPRSCQERPCFPNWPVSVLGALVRILRNVHRVLLLS